MKATEYAVDRNNGKWGAGPLQDFLNTYAEQGWRLVTAFWTAHDELTFVFEREIKE